ncbi:MAG: YitT family protein [Bacteroidales bacterium]|nr:YitT family protein [Candidatus Minthousia equi]
MELKSNFLWREAKDYLAITFGLLVYAMGWATFLLPYQISTGGTTGIGAILFYATGFPIQYTYLIINAVLILVAFRILGLRFTIRTSYAILMLSLFLGLSQSFVNNYLVADAYDTLVDGTRVPLVLGEGQEFMACLLGSVMCGFALGLVFNSNGSTGGIDILAACVNKYRDVSLGSVIMACDMLIISSCYFVFHSWQRVIFGFVTLFVVSFVLDYTVNAARRSVQFFIFSKKYADIADEINHRAHRGVTVLDGHGWYSKQEQKVLVVLTPKRQSVEIFRLIKSIDPDAFVSQSSVVGVYGQGFDRIKVKV